MGNTPAQLAPPPGHDRFTNTTGSGSPAGRLQRVSFGPVRLATGNIIHHHATGVGLAFFHVSPGTTWPFGVSGLNHNNIAPQATGTTFRSGITSNSPFASSAFQAICSLRLPTPLSLPGSFNLLPAFRQSGAFWAFAAWVSASALHFIGFHFRLTPAAPPLSLSRRPLFLQLASGRLRPVFSRSGRFTFLAFRQLQARPVRSGRRTAIAGISRPGSSQAPAPGFRLIGHPDRSRPTPAPSSLHHWPSSAFSRPGPARINVASRTDRC